MYNTIGVIKGNVQTYCSAIRIGSQNASPEKDNNI